MKRTQILSGLMSVSVALCGPIATRADNAPMAYDWEEITPCADLKWTPCFDNYSCARLEVPLDYTDPTAGTTAIAFLKQSAAQQPAEDILLNPGGPGGSGVAELLDGGPLISQLVGKQYNLVGFDPRGVNNSGPVIDCFKGNKTNEAFFQTQLIRSMDSRSHYSLVHEFELGGAYSAFCSEANKDTDAKYANTVGTASDMLRYVEKRNEALGQPASEAKLYYYGVSYGTVLGTTFASLFPDRIGRMVLDGVEDADDYYRGVWETQFDTTKAVEDFFFYCHQAGPDACAFWANSTQAIADRTKKVLEAVRQDPVPFTDASLTPYPQLVGYEALVFYLFFALYTPIERFPIAAQIFAEMENRNGTTLASIATLDLLTGAMPSELISCIDSAARNDRMTTLQKFEDHVNKVNKQAEWTGDGWAALPALCRNWTVSPPPSQQVKGTPSAANTSAPILFVSNTHDPATPISGAYKMSSLFPGSVVLAQEAVGHVAGFSAQSKCTAGYFQEYFATGELPPANATCKVESVPFITGRE